MRVTIWIPDDLVAEVNKAKPKINVSRTCREALRQALAQQQLEIAKHAY